MTAILLLVDLQQDYLNANHLEPAAGQIIDRASSLLQKCRAADIPVIHIWTTIARQDDLRMPHWREDGRWMCVEGTPGHAPPESLVPEAGETVVHKQFFSAFSSGTLAPLLKECQADTLIIAGIHLHACVRQTVLDAYTLGFDVWVAEDAVGSDDALHAMTTRRYLQSRAARFATSDDLLRILADKREPICFPPITEVGYNLDSITAHSRIAWKNWRVSGLAERRALLEALANCLEGKTGSLADQIVREVNKPITFAEIEVQRTAEMMRVIASQELGMEEQGVQGSVRRCPLGLVATITPWNNPVLIPLGKIAAAIFYGNAVIWKPAPAALGVGREIMACLHDAGCPDGLVSLVAGGNQCTIDLISHAQVDAVAITGGAIAGNCARDICARRHIPLQAELGGNNAAIVWPDCNLEDAASKIAEGAFAMAGQRCTANRRAIVHQDSYEVFLDLLTQSVMALPWGSPFLAKTRVGPLLNSGQCDRIKALVQRSASCAAKIIVPHGSNRPDDHSSGLDSAYYPPTIICCDDPKQEIVQEETFGPILVVQKATGFEQALELCNGVRQGLVAAIFTNSDAVQRRFLLDVQAGVLKINQSTADVGVHLPFGGWKASGAGPPEHGVADREWYTRIQTVYRQPSVSEPERRCR